MCLMQFLYAEAWDGKKFLECKDCLLKAECPNYEPKDEPQTERIKTPDYCDICNHKGCDNCIANSLDDYCVPSGYEPITKTETQNSNLTFEKADTPQTDCGWK